MLFNVYSPLTFLKLYIFFHLLFHGPFLPLVDFRKLGLEGQKGEKI